MSDVKKKEVPPLLFHFSIIQNDKTITYFVVKKKYVNSNVGSWKTGTFYVTDRHKRGSRGAARAVK